MTDKKEINYTHLMQILKDYDRINKKQKNFIEKNNFSIPDNSTATGYASDSAYNDYCNGVYDGVGFYDELIGNANFQGYAQLSYYRQHPIVNSIITTSANEMTRNWIRLTSKSDDDKSEIIKKLEYAMDKKFNIKELFRKTIESTILYGGALIYPKIKGDEADLSKELILNNSSIGINTIEYFQIVEPINCTVAETWNSTNPLLKDFYNPTSYQIYSNKVHISRLIKFTFIESPQLLKPLYRFFGIPLVQLCIRDIQRLENMKNSQEDIIARYNLSVIKADINTIIFGGDQAGSIVDRIDFFNYMKDNNGVLLLNKDSEDYTQHSLNITAVTDNIRQAVEFICMSIKTPATKFMGMSMGGFNSTGEHEIRTYYDNIASNQESMLRHNLRTVLHFIMLNEFGEIHEEIDFDFNSLWQNTELEESQIRLNETNRAVANVGATITTVDDERHRLNNDSSSLYDHLEMTKDYDIDIDIDGVKEDEENINSQLI